MIRPGAVVVRIGLAAAVAAAGGAAAYLALLWWPFALVVVVAVAARSRRVWWEMGTARFADGGEQYDYGMVGGCPLLARMEPGAVPLGAAARALLTAPLDRSGTANALVLTALGAGGRGPLLGAATAGHLLSVSPTGGGKGVGLLVPNLLAHPGPVVVTDLKDGENFRLTAAHRRAALGRTVVHLDPLAALAGSGSPPAFAVNGFDLIDRASPRLLDDVRAVFAKPLVQRADREGDGKFFTDTAETVLTAVCAFVARHGEPHERHLGTACRLLARPDAFAGTLAAMRRSRACGGGLADLAGQIGFLKERTFHDVMATLSQHLAVFASPPVRRGLHRTTFDWDAYAAGGVDVYLCLPADKTKSHAALVRHQLSVLMYALVRRGLTRDPARRALWLLDEIGHLGHVPLLEDALTLMRGYGVQLWYIVQGIGQLKKCFPTDGGETALANFEVQQFFELNDAATAEYCSARLGTATVPVATEQAGTGWTYTPPTGPSPGGYSYSGNASASVAPGGRKLMFADEILGPGMRGKCLIFARGCRPVRADRLVYHADPAFPAASRRPARVRAGPLLAAAFVAAVAALVAWSMLSDPAAGPDPPRLGAPAGAAAPFGPPR